MKERAQVEFRKGQTYRLFLRGLSGEEIAHQLGVSTRTIRSYVSEIKASLRQTIEHGNQYSLGMALAQLDELWRDAWQLYYLKPRKVWKLGADKQLVQEDEDVLIRRLLVIDRLLKIIRERDRITGLRSPAAPSVEIQPVTPLTFQGVKITSTADAEEIVRKAGQEMEKYYEEHGRPTF